MSPDPVKGFLLGLAMGTLCLSHCLPILLPTLAVTRENSLRASLLRLAEFSAGRAMACLAVGSLLGWTSAWTALEPARRILSLLYIPLGLLLLLHVLRESGSPSRVCRAIHERRRWVRTPLLIGVFTGFAPCAPFGLAMVNLLEGVTGSPATRALQGLAYFAFFFAGTTVILLPLALAGLATRFKAVSRGARAIAVLASLFFIFTGLAGFVRTPGADAGMREALAPEEGDLRYVFPEADGFSPLVHDAGFPYWWALRKGAIPSRGGGSVETPRKIGVCFVTRDVVPGVEGWAGEVPVLVGLSSEGTIRGVLVLPGANRETPGFIDPLYEEDFDRQYRGLEAEAPIEAGTDVDGITGATASVAAVNEGIRLSVCKAAVEVLGLDPGEGPGRRGASAFTATPVLVLSFLTLLAVLGFVLRPGRKYRTGVLLLSLAALGIWQAFYLTGADLARAFILDVPPGPLRIPWVLLVGAAALLTLFAGKLYCGWLCPFGAFSELLYRITPGRLEFSEGWDRLLRNVRFLFLLGLPALVVLTDDPGAVRFDPLASLFHPRSWTLAAWVLLAWVGIASVFVERFHCKFLCPVGAVVDMLSAERFFGRQAGVVCGGCVRGESGCRYLGERGEDYRARRESLRGDCIC